MYRLQCECTPGIVHPGGPAYIIKPKLLTLFSVCPTRVKAT